MPAPQTSLSWPDFEVLAGFLASMRELSNLCTTTCSPVSKVLELGALHEEMPLGSF